MVDLKEVNLDKDVTEKVNFDSPKTNEANPVTLPKEDSIVLANTFSNIPLTQHNMVPEQLSEEIEVQSLPPPRDDRTEIDNNEDPLDIHDSLEETQVQTVKWKQPKKNNAQQLPSNSSIIFGDLE